MSKARINVNKLNDVFSVREFNAKGDGTTNDAPAIENAINAALAANRVIYFPAGTYLISGNRTFTYTGPLRLVGDNATLLLNSTYTSFYGQVAATTTLAANATINSRTITVSNSSNLAIGQSLYFNTNTPVDSAYSYKKQAVLRIAYISGATVHLSEPLNFDFTSAETTLIAYHRATLAISGMNIKLNGFVPATRFDIRQMQDVELQDLSLEDPSGRNLDVVFIGETSGVTARNIRIQGGRYPFNVSNGSRNLLFENVYAQDCRHPIDCNTWAYNCTIRRIQGLNTEGVIESHPSFEVHFEDVVDVIEGSAGGVGLRCIGGSVKRAVVTNTTGAITNDVQSPLLLPAYQSIGQDYERTYEDIKSNTAILSASFVRRLNVKNCKVPAVKADGEAATAVTAVEIDTDTVFLQPASVQLRRTQVIAPKEPVWITPFQSFATTGSPVSITNITNANPATVTAATHGFNNGDVVFIDGVGGMTQVNKLAFVVANAATNTFELTGVNSTAYSAYTSGGKATKGANNFQTIDLRQTPGAGWYSRVDVKSVLRNNPNTIGATSLTIPVKYINVWDIQELPSRHLILTLKVHSVTDGAVVAKYQASQFLNATSNFTLSSATSVAATISTIAAVINNARPHYATEITAEGGNAATDAQFGLYYCTFDVVITVDNSTDRINYVELGIEEIRHDYS